MVTETPDSWGARIRDAVDGPSGYVVIPALDAAELAAVSSLIEAHWLGRLAEHAPDMVDAFRTRGMGGYHELADRIDHAGLWSKPVRILPPEAVETIRATSLFERLEAAFGPFAISDEEDVGYEEIYWRLVRPDAVDDVGPLHADAWFWKLGHGVTPPGVTRVKVWVAVACERGRSGLRLAPGSHRKDWRYHGELRHGFVKPQIDETQELPDAAVVDTAPGEAVVFNDRMLHGGAVTRGARCRVSFEFTMFVQPQGAA